MAILDTHIDPRDVYPQIARLLNLPPEMCWRKCTITFTSLGLITADYEGYQAKKPEGERLPPRPAANPGEGRCG